VFVIRVGVFWNVRTTWPTALTAAAGRAGAAPFLLASEKLIDPPPPVRLVRLGRIVSQPLVEPLEFNTRVDGREKL